MKASEFHLPVLNKTVKTVYFTHSTVWSSLYGKRSIINSSSEVEIHLTPLGVFFIHSPKNKATDQEASKMLVPWTKIEGVSFDCANQA